MAAPSDNKVNRARGVRDQTSSELMNNSLKFEMIQACRAVGCLEPASSRLPRKVSLVSLPLEVF